MVACSKARFDLVRLLVEEAGVDVNETDAGGETCLFYAVRCGLGLGVFDYLVAEGGADVRVRNGRGFTLADVAGGRGGVGVVEKLVERGVRISGAVLEKAAVEANAEMVRVVFEAAEVEEWEKVKALEIIGVTLTDGRRSRECAKKACAFCVMYWEISLDKRYFG